MLELITPEAKTRTKAKPARAEKRRSVGSVISGRLPDFEPDAAPPSTPESRASMMMPPTQADTPTRCRPSELMAPSWSAELAEWPISADGTSPMRESTRVAARAAPGADAEECRGDHGGDDDNGQPGAAGLDVGHEVDQGAGELRVPGDRPGRRCPSSSAPARQSPTASRRPRRRRRRQRPGEGRMFRGVLVLGPGAGEGAGQDSDGEEQAADHCGQRDVVHGLADRQAPADQGARVGDLAGGCGAGEQQRGNKSQEQRRKAGEQPGPGDPAGTRNGAPRSPGRGGSGWWWHGDLLRKAQFHCPLRPACPPNRALPATARARRRRGG